MDHAPTIFMLSMGYTGRSSLHIFLWFVLKYWLLQYEMKILKGLK